MSGSRWISFKTIDCVYVYDDTETRKMSFAAPKTIIEENDTIILYLTVQNMHAIDVCPVILNKKGQEVENIFQTSYGALKVKDVIGLKYGSKVGHR